MAMMINEASLLELNLDCMYEYDTGVQDSIVAKPIAAYWLFKRL